MFPRSLGLLAFFALLGVAMAGPVRAADTAVRATGSHSKVVVAPMVAPAVAEGGLATVVPPRIAYGCKRLWRCDTQVCEWRRGCWGVYGYMEGPYYSVALAKRQWERDGWPSPSRER